MDFFDVVKLNLSGVCLGCLNSNRKMYYSDRIKDFFKRNADIDVPEGIIVKVCWECMAYVNNVFRFKGTVERSYQILSDYILKNQALGAPEDFSVNGYQRLQIMNTELITLPPQQELPVEFDIKVEQEAIGESDISIDCDPLEQRLNTETLKEETSVTEFESSKTTSNKCQDLLVPMERNTPGPISRYICDYCSREFPFRSLLITHVYAHTGEKIISCELCAYKCNKKSDLKTHMRVHTGEKPFSCKQCSYKCNRRSNLTTHMRLHTGEKPFSCKLCLYTCSRSDTLKRHIRTHTSENHSVENYVHMWP